MKNEDPTEHEMLIQDERLIIEDIEYAKDQLSILEDILRDTREKLSAYTT
jgi:hypothetical protein